MWDQGKRPPLVCVLSQRSQTVHSSRKAPGHPLWSWEGPQGSVLGPILDTLYTAPLGDIIRKHGVLFHRHADYCQVYVPFKSSPDEAPDALSKIEACAKEIYA